MGIIICGDLYRLVNPYLSQYFDHVRIPHSAQNMTIPSTNGCPESFSMWLATISPLPDAERLSLLQSTNTLERLQRSSNSIGEIISRMNQLHPVSRVLRMVRSAFLGSAGEGADEEEDAEGAEGDDTGRNGDNEDNTEQEEEKEEENGAGGGEGDEREDASEEGTDEAAIVESSAIAASSGAPGTSETRAGSSGSSVNIPISSAGADAVLAAALAHAASSSRRNARTDLLSQEAPSPAGSSSRAIAATTSGGARSGNPGTYAGTGAGTISNSVLGNRSRADSSDDYDDALES